MNNLTEVVNAAVELEPREEVLDGWSAVHLANPSPNQIFHGPMFDYQGYMILTSRRLIFVNKAPFAPVRVVPGLCFRLDDIVDVQVKGKELALLRQRFRILGVKSDRVQNEIRIAIFKRLQEKKRMPMMNDLLRSESARGRRNAGQEEEVAPRERIKLLQCSSCGVWNPSDLKVCESCGKRLPLQAP
jgi:hypothetical protein